MSLFAGKKKRSPAELIKLTREALENLEKGGSEKVIEKSTSEVSKSFAAMKAALYGTQDVVPNTELVNQLAKEIYQHDVLILMVSTLRHFEFEAKKDAALVFNNLLRRSIGQRNWCVEYICRNTVILERLIEGYDHPDIALNCGSMLRECIQHEPLAKILLYSDQFYDLFTYVELSNFDLASDAFATFKELLTTHKQLAAEFLEKNYDMVFEKYTKLLHSKNYVTRRQSLKLLGELLLDRPNFNIMTRYISDKENLKLMMNLLRDKSASIQFEAFHVFKVFVANPNKSAPILNILVRNKAKLSAFLTNFQNERGGEEEQFADEKAFLLKQIDQL